MKIITIADLEGEWTDPDWESGLIQRCKNAWNKNIENLTNKEIATFLRQNIAVNHLLPLAKKRIADGYDDDSEMFDGELKETVEEINKNVQQAGRTPAAPQRHSSVNVRGKGNE